MTTFKDLLNQKAWSTYDDYISEGITSYTKDLKQQINQGKSLKGKIREYIEKHFTINHISEKDLTREKELLSLGEVVGIDGTVAQHKTISGTMAQFGVIAVNYQNEKMRHSCFVSETQIREEIKDVADYLYSHEPQNMILSNLVIRAILLYKEREVGLNDQFKNKFKIFHGPLLPFELLTGLGKLRALETTVHLCQKIINDRKSFSIVSRSQNNAFIRLGLSLNKFEYIELKHTNIGSEIMNNPRFLPRDKWREDEFLMVNDFLTKSASKIKIGLIRISERPYVFHAHEDFFDLAAKIIARDSMFQKEKGFPLLIDYADNLCSTFFKASDFNKIIEYQLAKEGEFLSEMSEETLRQK